VRHSVEKYFYSCNIETMHTKPIAFANHTFVTAEPWHKPGTSLYTIPRQSPCYFTTALGNEYVLRLDHDITAPNPRYAQLLAMSWALHHLPEVRMPAIIRPDKQHHGYGTNIDINYNDAHSVVVHEVTTQTTSVLMLVGLVAFPQNDLLGVELILLAPWAMTAFNAQLDEFLKLCRARKNRRSGR